MSAFSTTLRSRKFFMLRFIRFNSIASLKPKLISGSVPLTKQVISKAIGNNELQDLKAVLTENKQLLTPSIKHELADIINHDFSLYYLLKDHQFTISQLASLIIGNPGRVDSSWDLFQRHGGDHDDIYVELIRKLIHGEKSEEIEQVSGSNWAKVLYLFNRMDNKDLVVEELFEKLVSSNNPIMKYFKFDNEFLMMRVSQLDGVPFVVVFNQIHTEVDFTSVDSTQGGSTSGLGLMAKGLDLNYKFNLSIDAEFLNEYKRLSNDVLTSVNRTDILQFIDSKKIDTNSHPESLLVRMKVMEVYGMELDNFEKLLERYHHYQTHAKFGIEIIQSILIQSYCYKCFNDKNPQLLDIIEVLMLENIPIKILQALMLTHSQFDADKSLEVYNKYIRHVSTKPNENTGRSPAGLLNESLMLAYLYNNDREFANIIYDKVVQSKLLVDSEVDILKRLFKVYGEAFEEDNWEIAKVKLGDYVKRVIRGL